MDLYHTTSGARMKQEITRHYCTRLDPARPKWLFSLLRLLGRVLAQPQRDVLWLHRLPHDRYQLGIQTVKVRLVPEPGRETFQSLSSIVLPTVESPVYERLNAPSQRVEQCCYGEGGDHDGELRKLLSAGKGLDDGLGGGHASEIERNQHRGQ